MPGAARPFCIVGVLVESVADGVDEFGGAFGYFHDDVGGVGSAVGVAGGEGDGLHSGPAVVGDCEGFVAVLGGEGVAEEHDVDGGFVGKLLDVG